MKKRRKKHKKTGRGGEMDYKMSQGVMSQITISHFADAAGDISSSAGKCQRVTKSMTSENLLLHLHTHDQVEEDPEEDQQAIALKTAPTMKKAREEEDELSSYPFDIWDILSGYIHPESINVYSRLCKSAYSSIQRVSFWLNLYERCCLLPSRRVFKKTRKELLPDHLQSEYVLFLL